LTLARQPELKRRIKKILRDKRTYIIWESDIQELLDHFKSDTYDILLISSLVVRNSEEKCLKLLDTISKKSPKTQVIFLVEPEEVDIPISALKAGTYHYVKLPMDDRELRLLIDTALKDRPSFGQNLLREEDNKKTRLDQIIGKSEAMQHVYEQIHQAASTDIHILLLGETGTGKDLVASTIHRMSDRSGEAYIPVNLGSLPLELVASELFGHMKGAFTGAVDRRIGVFERGSKGTVFLDEIDTIDEKIRVSLLRLIEQKEFNRLGGKAKIKSDARIIAASNTDLEELVKTGNFRKDLFYRLDAFRINLPPLRERHGDIPLLVENMLSRYNHSFKKNIKKISREYLDLLESYDWPGNIRELRNVVQRSVLVCNDTELRPEHLPRKFGDLDKKPSRISFEIGTSLENVEREMLIRALAETNNNRTRAAELLGISRRVIYNKLNKHKIK